MTFTNLSMTDTTATKDAFILGLFCRTLQELLRKDTFVCDKTDFTQLFKEQNNFRI